MAISEATRLRAPGVAINLGGESVPLKFDWDALAGLEDLYDGLDGLVAELQRGGWSKGRLQNLRTIMHAALGHTGRADELVKLLDFKQVVSYLIALNEAFLQAMPDAEEDASPNVGGKPAGFPGKGSIKARRVTGVRPKSSFA